MQKTKFYRFGEWVYRLRLPIIIVWVVLLLACLPFLPNIISPFKTTGFTDEHSESVKTESYIDKQFGYLQANKFFIMYKSKTLLATDPVFRDKIKKSLEALNSFPIKNEIIYPSDNKKQISKDKHTAFAIVIVKSPKPLSDSLLDELKKRIKKPPRMSMELGGEPFFVEEVNKQTQEDLYNADFIATPVSLITLILVFGSLIAATIPILLGGGCALIILTSLFFLGHQLTLSVFTINIALLLGLCLSLDYALFIISRFRDELAKGLGIAEAIAVTQATAGKAIFFSGLAVFASLSALFLFPINILFSIAVGGLTAVCIAVLVAIIVLPAILAVLKGKINLIPVRLFKIKKSTSSPFWHWLATKVVKRPLLYFFSILIFLLALGYPFLSATFGVSDYHIFPENSENRQFFDTYTEQFNAQELTPIVMLVQTKKPILTESTLGKIVDLSNTLKEKRSIKEVGSLVNLDSDFKKKDYYSLYVTHKDLMSKSIEKILHTTTLKQLTLITVVSKYPINAVQTEQLVNDLKATKVNKGMRLRLTGTPVKNSDLLHSISNTLPAAILWIFCFTYLILLILLRSLFLPFKAILMNILSLSACYGALVLVFQDGYLHQYLNFEPQGMLDISLLVIIFCALFGFSMDYEVFLLTRIKESYEATHDNKKSVVFGIEKSSRIITSAALIVICICFSFLVADILIVKAFGLGIAVAIFVDAFLIRTFLVPSTMIILKDLNWYLPKWLDKILPKL
ncbi:MAG: MMPL family transporter [Tatlockia sp.]|jgi:RND superfamily putative drug exporter